MNHKLTIIFLVGVLLFTGCKEKKEIQIPEGAFPFVYTRHIYIEGLADSIKGNYVFDTGAANLYIDSTHYADNEFSHKKNFTALMPGVGSTPQKVVVIKDTVAFQFDKELYKTTKVPVFQLKPILGDIADGILGRDYFRNSILEINYEMQYMKLYQSMDWIDIQGWTKIKLSDRDGTLYVPLEVIINDTINISGQYLLDFGSGGGVGLSSPVSEKYNLRENINNKALYYTKYGGVGGESSSYYFIASSVKIGDFKFDNVLTSFSLDTKGAMASEKRPGIVGNEIYKRFHVYIDFINNDLYLKPNKNYHNPFKITRLGFEYVDRGQVLKSWIVTGLYSSSNAEKEGLKIDDKIISVNGISISEMTYEFQKAYFDEIDEINLKVERDGEFIDIRFSLSPIISSGNTGYTQKGF